MKKGHTAAACFLALGFGTITFILFFVEPGMGFSGPADFFDPAKVVKGSASLAWLVGDLVLLGFGAALGYLASSSNDRYLRASGLSAAVLFVFIGCLGRVLAGLPAFIGNAGHLEIAVLGLVPVRLAALRTAVLAFGFFAWRTTRDNEPGEPTPAAWRGLGYLVLAASAVFVFVFVPAPPLFAIWAAWFALRLARTPNEIDSSA